MEYPEGFSGFSTASGIKRSGKKDVAVIFSEKEAACAAVYTSNKVKGAPLIVTKRHLENGKAKAIIVNSGIANVAADGIKDAEEMCSLCAEKLGIAKEDVLVASTGKIGVKLPMHKIKDAISRIKLGDDDISEAILTTDKKRKVEEAKVGEARILAFAKGSGMIHPNMATMLAFILTDAEIEHGTLNKMLKKAVDDSFNMITVDNDMSTSDMVIVMANGAKGKVDEDQFFNALNRICVSLAKKIAGDGEGATKLLEVKAKARSKDDARKIAKAVAGSSLLKAGMFGNDSNWGRVIAAAGYSGADLDPDKISIRMQGIEVAKGGKGTKFDKEGLREKLKADVVIEIYAGGDEEATAYGCDLSYDYVKINAEYET